MQIKDLQPRQGKVDIVIEVIEKGDTREFEKFGRKGRVCSAKAKDASGEIVLSLWNEQIDQVNIGDTIKITNGYVSEFQGEKQLTTGKFGKLEITSKGTPAAEEKEEKPVTKKEDPSASSGQEKKEEKSKIKQEEKKEKVKGEIKK